MVIKGVATLIYMAKSHNDYDGSPINLFKEKTVKVDVISTFTNGYYFERGREMREACNLLVNNYNTFDIVDDGLTYELSYVVFKNVKYKVMNILNHYARYQEDPFRKVLDCKKVTNA